MQLGTQRYLLIAMVLGSIPSGCGGSSNDAACTATFGECGSQTDANVFDAGARGPFIAFDALGAPGSPGTTCNMTKQGACFIDNFCEFSGNTCGLTSQSDYLFPKDDGGADSDAGALAIDAADLPLMVFYQGLCVSRSQTCTALNAPVCGCDRKTYTNDCLRKVAGVSKRADGACANER